MESSIDPAGRLSFLAGGAETGAHLRAFDWATTPLGDPGAWPQPLRTLVAVMLGSNQPMFVVWGPDARLIYNDCYAAEILAGKHPEALGRPFLEVWSEASADLEPILARAYAGESTHMDDIALMIRRHGYLEEAHFSFSYTPVRDESGQVAGVFCPCSDITAQVEAERRQAFQLRLEQRLRDLSDPVEIIAAAQAALGEHLGTSRVGYGEVDAGARYFTTERNWTDGTVPPRSGVHDLEGFGPEIVAALRRGDILVVHDVSQDRRTNAPEALAAFAAIDTAAVVTASLIKDGRMTAALYVHDRRPRRWSEADVELVAQVAERTWAAVERARAERGRRAAEGRVADVLESMREGFMLLDRDFRIVRINPEALRLDGREEAAILGRTHWQAWPQTDEAVSAALRRAMAERIPVAREGCYAFPDGREAWLEMRAYPAADGLAVFYRDVSARRALAENQRRIEAELRESEARLRVAQSAGGIGSFELLPERGRILVSEQFCRLWGAPFRPEYDVRDFIALIHPEDQPRVLTGRRDLPDAAAGYIEYRIIRADDREVRWMARRAELVPSDTGERRLLGVTYDITDRKRAEEALQRLNETLEAQVAERTAERDRMWRLSRDVMVVCDFAGRIVAANPAWKLLFDRDEEELIGTSILDLVHPDDRASTAAEVAALSTGVATPRFENRYRHKDGSYRWLSWTAVPDESFLHAVGRDISAEKQAAAELEQAQEALRQSQKMEAVGQLTGGIAHDFNNLLTGVIGSLELLTRRLGQGRLTDLDRYAAAATASANRAAALTQRLLAFSRRQPLHPRPTDANRLVLGMDELLRRSLGEAVRLEMVATGGLWTTLCDPHQLESAILNLAINARDAMPDGGVLTIETCNVRLDDAYVARQREVKPGQYVCICVSDTGAGIPPDVLSRVFEPFFTTKPIGQGTGLGLSMVYGFVRQSDGYVKIYSEPGEGTTVKIYLPRHYGAAEEDEAPKAPGAGPEGLGEAVVLVVEDEAAVRDLVVEVLREQGCVAIEASDGPAGLRVLQSDRRIDLLVTDVGLPGLNGRQLADAARALRPDLKVLFMTGYAENAAVAGGFLEPGMEMITKPFAIEALAGRLRELVHRG